MSEGGRAPVGRALLSVYDKTGLVALGRFLAERGVEILSTGGSARALTGAGVPVKEVGAHTGFPEMLDGRVKTLHPVIHGGILGRRDLVEHRAAMAEHAIAPIDLVAVNLYPFEATVASGADWARCIENIDIGGPALIRAAAKNHADVCILTDPADYEALMAEMRAAPDGRSTTLALRRRLAGKAYATTAAYDGAIAAWWAAQEEAGALPARLVLSLERRQALRYGENPHQAAALYLPARRADAAPGAATAAQVQGKELSYNNLADADAAFALAAEFAASGAGGPGSDQSLDHPAAVIVKHANPCGVAIGQTLAQAYRRAFACDPVSAYGGIVAVNRPLDAATAEAIGEQFIEVVIAPHFGAAAREILAAKKNLRLLEAGAMPDPAAPGLALRSLGAGYLVQSFDNGRIGRNELKVVTRRAPGDKELADLLFAFRVAKHVRSNAIVYARDGATIGIGAGQMSRVDSSRIAAWKAGEAALAAGRKPARPCEGAVVASDAFFPFADGLLAAVEAGATAVIQPGGSLRDEEVIAAADAAGIAMVFTGMRHFRH
jgi:phosphoribosylaminoimidazolecarboxamide formyltransferase/IMP cyclohydrolase